MKTSGTARVIATVFLGVLTGIYIHFNETRMLARGRDAFLAAQEHRFDRIVMYHSSVTMLIAGVILVAVGVALYESIAWGFTRMIPPSEIEE
jgi:hypothetical protein